MTRELHRARLPCDAAESEDGVQAAKSERIRKRSLDLRRTRFVWHDIEVAGGITLNKIRGWWDEISVDGKDRGRRFQGSGRAECVTVHGFGGTNGKAVRVRPKDLAERARFRGIVRRRSSAVSIHVRDLLARKPGIVECTTHCSSSAFR